MLIILPYRQILNFVKIDLTISKYAQKGAEMGKDRKKRRILIALTVVGMNHEFLPNNPEYMWIKDVNTSAVKHNIDDAAMHFRSSLIRKAGFCNSKRKRTPM